MGNLIVSHSRVYKFMLNFKNIEINDIEIYKEFMINSDELSCENAFVNLLVWQSAYNNMLAVKDDILFIKSGKKGNESFRLPNGQDLEKGIFLLREYLGCEPVFWAQEGSGLEKFRNTVGRSYTFYENRDASDYIYLQSDLANLSGKKYHSKRNHISAFSKSFDWHYESINDGNKDAVRKCAELWYQENADRLDKTMLCEQKGIDIMLSNMERLSVRGGAIFVDGKAVAFCLGSPINSDCFDTHIEKALSDYSGAYAVINREFAKNELSDYKYINREDDLGLEGLRKAKLSYKPCILLKKYECIG